MADDFTIPDCNRLNIPEASLFLEAQSCAYKIVSKQVQLACLFNGLTPEVSELVYDVLGKPSTTPYDDHKFAILERVEEAKLEVIKRPRKEPMNGVTKGPRLQKRESALPARANTRHPQEIRKVKEHSETRSDESPKNTPTGNRAQKFTKVYQPQTVSSPPSVNICKSSLIETADPIPFTSVFRNVFTASKSQHLITPT
ncbi:hypothetical protein ACTXT7_000277 [Hymenolepis weldensis]